MVDCQKRGYNAEKVAEMIKSLPDSFLPDEQDKELYNTMTQFDTESNQVLSGFNLNLNFGGIGSDATAKNANKEESQLQGGASALKDSMLSVEGVSTEQLINVHDFSLDRHPELGGGATTFESLDSPRHLSANVAHTLRTSRRKDKRNADELKLIEMHMKRRVPQLYLNTQGKQREKLSDFNDVMKQSLLSP